MPRNERWQVAVVVVVVVVVDDDVVVAAVRCERRLRQSRKKKVGSESRWWKVQNLELSFKKTPSLGGLISLTSHQKMPISCNLWKDTERRLIEGDVEHSGQ